MATVHYDTITMAAASLLISRTGDGNVAAALTENVPAVGMSQIHHFQAHEIADLKLHMKHTQPEWYAKVRSWSDRRDENIDFAVQFLEAGGLVNNHLVLPNEALTFQGLNSTATAIVELSKGRQRGPWRMDDPEPYQQGQMVTTWEQQAQRQQALLRNQEREGRREAGGRHDRQQGGHGGGRDEHYGYGGGYSGRDGGNGGERHERYEEEHHDDYYDHNF